MVRRRLLEELSVEEWMLDLKNWPKVDITLLSKEHQEMYLKRKQAMDLYFMSERSVTDIIQQTGITYKRISYFVKRCLYPNNNGSIFGYTALIPYKRIDKNQFPSAPPNYIDTGKAGSFTVLLNTHPQLRVFLEDMVLPKKKNEIVEKGMMIKVLHKKFLQLCKEIGIRSHQYPFTTKDFAKRSLERYIVKLKKEHLIVYTFQENKELGSYMAHNGVGVKNHPLIARPYRRVQFDAHKIDILISITFLTPEGDEVTKILDRIWILNIIDEATRCVLGYHLCLNKEYSSWDVLKCLHNAVKPQVDPEFSIPGLKLSENAGFPSQKFETCKWALWDEFLIDNAKANDAQLVTEKLKHVIGCSINQGPVSMPERRPIIERFFGLLEENGFHRLPNTTGSDPTDTKRNKPEEYAIKYRISEWEIEELTTALIAEYNATPHSGLGYLSPLEAMEQRIQRYFVRTLGEEERENLSFFVLRAKRTIRGKDRRPYIQYKAVEYRNDIIANLPDLVGTELELLINIDDLRSIRAFFRDGSELGLLYATGKWGISKHSLKTREAIISLRNKKLIHFTEFEDPIEVFQRYLEKKGTRYKTARNQLANLKKEREKEVPSSIPAFESEESSLIQKEFIEIGSKNKKRRFTKTLGY
ncbi:hypothetical protein [Bacillus paranthracis]|uniref:hypothetical protein n=1 Tax=Bacillus paranthracis TaxID=2026186 RepID=UPI003D202D83